MNEIYNYVRDLLFANSIFGKATFLIKRNSFKILLLTLLFTFGSRNVHSQTTLISSSGDGGFENGSTFAANGWTNSSSANNPWIIGTAVSSAPISGNSAYISNDGVSNLYTPANDASNFFWRDVTVPAGETVVKLSFNWICQGESTWDNWQVFYAPTSVVPTGSATHPGNGATNVPAGIAGATWLGNGNLQGTVQTTTIYLPASLAGTTFRLIFHWKNEADGTQPPASIDNISLTSRFSGTYTSVASGNWSLGSTWDVGTAPTAYDNAIVSTGHVVSSDLSGQEITNLTVNGTLDYGVTPTSFSVNGNLYVTSVGLVNAFNSTTGKTLIVKGNIINNGIIDISVGTTSAGNLTLSGSAVQTINGTGTFNTNVIRNLTFGNTSLVTPNIIWSFNNLKIAYNLNLTSARIDLGSNKMTFGNGAAGNTLTAPSGTGFLTGATFSRWWSATATGSAITAGTDPSNGTSRYPFINTSGAQRALYISRVGTTTGNVAGELSAIYSDANTSTSGLSVVDGAYTITDRYDGKWTITKDASYVANGTHSLVLIANNALYASNGNARIMLANAIIGGVHQNGTTTPGAQRTGLTTADITAGDIYLGIAAADVPFVSIANGDWSSTTTWNKGLAPTCNDLVTIGAGTIVTVNSAGNVSKNVTITAGSTLSIVSGDLTVGCALNNNLLTNNGTLTVSGGTLNVNGNITNPNLTSVFNQSGGGINIDGNDAGIVANSVASGTPLLNFNQLSANISLTGGNITIIDPHTATTNTNGYAIYYNNATASSNSVNENHKFIFGDGISTTSGGHINGFYVNNWVGSAILNMGSVVVNGPVGTNRKVTSYYQLYVKGNYSVNNGGESEISSLYFGGNLNVNSGGTLTTSTALYTTILNSPTTTGVASSNAQTISGSGVFRNLVTLATANLTSLTVNNSNLSGITLNVPLTVSGTLTLTQGTVTTTNTNLLTIGTATAAGTLVGGSVTAYVKGPLARTIASGNTNSTFITFPVGKTTYAPVELAPSTSTVSVMKAEAFDSNSGTIDASIINMSTNRRWEAPLVSGTISDINVKLTDAGIASTSIPVQASSASGQYTNAFGSVATAVAGVTTQSNTAVTSANYSGFLSYATSNSCSGTPSPGNTVASANVICLGESITLSLQNSTSGSGVTYAWESSTDGVIYTAISGAINLSLSVLPTTSTYYRCNVTCSSNTSSSTAVQITFANAIATTTPATRCGIGTVSLAATSNAGSTINWYDTLSGGNLVGTGNTLVTPTINTTTTFYVGSESAALGSLQFGSGITTSGTNLSAFNNYRSSAKYHMIYTSSELLASGLRPGNINSIAYNVVSLGDLPTNTNYTVKIGSTSLPTFVNNTYTIPNFTTCYGPSTYTHTSSGWQTINFTTPYNWDGTSNIIIEVTHDGADGSSSANTQYTATAGNTVLYSYNGLATSNTLSINRFNVLFSGQVVCSSPRVAVSATVTTPPVLSISATTAVTCESVSTSTINLTSVVSDYNTYTWSPSTNVSGNETIGWTFNPSVSTTYILTATQTSGSLCSNTISIAVTVNKLPSTMAISPVTGSVCSDVILPLVASGGIIGIQGKIGSGALTNLLSTPFKGYYGGSKSQVLYTASELTALGMVAGQKVSSIGFVALSGTPIVLNSLNINAGFVPNTNLGTAFITGANNIVLAPINFTPTSGIGNLDFMLSTPLVWDGISNLLVETCFNNNNGGGTAANSISLESTAVASGLNTYLSQDNNATVCSNAVATTSSTNRPNLRISILEDTSLSWSPTTNLYSDAAATTPYLGGSASTVYFKSSSAAPATTYTATASSSVGCLRTATVVVTAYQTQAPTGLQFYQFCPTSGATLNDISATLIGTEIKWYAAPSGGTQLAPTTSLSQGYYWASQTANGCESQTRFAVFAISNATAAPSSNPLQQFCNSATVSSLSANGSGLQWYSVSANGVALFSTDSISTGTYYVSQTSGGCESPRTAVAVIVSAVSAPSGFETQSLSSLLTIGDIVVVGTNVVWYESSADAVSGSNPLPSSTLLSNTTYYATQTVSGCTSITSLAVTITTLANQDFDLTQFSYYPNPVINLLNVTYSQDMTNVKVFNMIGQQLLNKEVNATSTQIDMASFANGAYFIQVFTENAMKTVRVIKK